MHQTLPTYRDPRVTPSNPHYENPRYVAPIPPVDPWARAPYAAHPQPPMPTRAPVRQPMRLAPSQTHEFDFRPRHRKRRPWFGVGVAAIMIALVIALVVARGSDGPSDSGSTPGMITAGNLRPGAPTPPAEQKNETSADEAELDQLVADFRDAADIGPTSNWMTYYCSADRAVIQRAKITTIVVSSKNVDSSSPLTDVEVTGKRASGELNGSAITFRKESGDWEFCMTT